MSETSDMCSLSTTSFPAPSSLTKGWLSKEAASWTRDAHFLSMASLSD